MQKQALALSSTVVVSPHQVSTDLGDETVILGAEAGHYYGLNEVGARIWSLIQQPTRVSALCDTIAAEYDVSPDTCARDVLELLGELEDKGLIHVRSEVGAP